MLCLPLFTIPLAAESGDQFAFMWEEQQWTFQVLPQGSLHSCTICDRMVAPDLSVSFPTSVKWALYTDDTMLIYEGLPLLQNTLQPLLDCLQGRE